MRISRILLRGPRDPPRGRVRKMPGAARARRKTLRTERKRKKEGEINDATSGASLTRLNRDGPVATSFGRRPFHCRYPSNSAKQFGVGYAEPFLGRPALLSDMAGLLAFGSTSRAAFPIRLCGAVAVWRDTRRVQLRGQLRLRLVPVRIPFSPFRRRRIGTMSTKKCSVRPEERQGGVEQRLNTANPTAATIVTDCAGGKASHFEGKEKRCLLSIFISAPFFFRENFGHIRKAWDQPRGVAQKESNPDRKTSARRNAS